MEYVGIRPPPKVGGGHIRKGAQKRMGVSDSLKTNDMWSKTIGYDPYASSGETQKREVKEEVNESLQAQGREVLLRMTGASCGRTVGACRKCGQIGHLPYQCRNFITINEAAPVKAAALDEDVSDDPDSDEDVENRLKAMEEQLGGEPEPKKDKKTKKKEKKEKKKDKKEKKEEKRKEREKRRKKKKKRREEREVIKDSKKKKKKKRKYSSSESSSSESDSE